MVKGGFQGLDITGVDLTAQSPTLPGAYATCAGADGKPIRVQTADGQVECSVKKVSTNYVLAGITGDGKILSITIGSTDGISVVENVPGVEPEVFPNSRSIASATESEPYIAEYDGIVKLQKINTATSSEAQTVSFRSGSTHAGKVLLLSLPGDAARNSVASCFVKKGTILYGTNIDENVTLNIVLYQPY